MSNVSEALRKAVKNRQAYIYRNSEMQFEIVLTEAKNILPDEAGKSYFPMAIRTLWSPFDGASSDETNCWFKSLPARYAVWRKENGWLINSKERISGAPTKAGIEALAQLLISVRQRQRELQTRGLAPRTLQ